MHSFKWILMTTRVSILWKGQTMCTLRPREAGSICYSEDAPGLSSTQQKRLNRKNTVSWERVASCEDKMIQEDLSNPVLLTKISSCLLNTVARYLWGLRHCSWPFSHLPFLEAAGRMLEGNLSSLWCVPPLM